MFLAFYLMSPCLGIYSGVIILNSEKALYIIDTTLLFVRVKY